MLGWGSESGWTDAYFYTSGVWRGIMPTNDLHRACGSEYGHDADWGRAGALLGLGEGADPHPDANRLCAEKDDYLPLQLAVENKAPPKLLARIEAAHPLEHWGLTLHEVISKVGSAEALAPKVLKLVTPEACAEKDKHGNLPLHLALRNKAPPKVLEMLRKASGLGVVLQCKDWEAIERLGLITPEACAEKDSGGMLPLHWALHRKAPKVVLLAIIDAHPQVAATLNRVERRSSPLLAPCRRFLALGSGLGLVGTVSARW